MPGPRPLPIIGNALELPEYPEKQYMKWAREYGELFQVQLGWNNWGFVCGEEAVKVITLSEFPSISLHLSSPGPVSSPVSFVNVSTLLLHS